MTHTFIMEKVIIDAINHIKTVSRKQVSFDKILRYIKKNTQMNLDDESLKNLIEKMIKDDVIDKNYCILKPPVNTPTTLSNETPINKNVINSTPSPKNSSETRSFVIHQPLLHSPPTPSIVIEQAKKGVNNLTLQDLVEAKNHKCH